MSFFRPDNVCKLLISLILLSCSSAEINSSSSDVLEPEDTPQANEETPSPQSATHQRVLQKLQSLGYEGMGLQFESEETLLMLEQVFSDPFVTGRKIRLVYTGLEMSYDPQYESITIGGLTNAMDVVNYIKKKVPKRETK